VIADAVYDRPFRRLQQLEERFPALAAVSSPTRRVGAGPAASCSTRVTELDEGQFMDLIHSSEGD